MTKGGLCRRLLGANSNGGRRRRGGTRRGGSIFSILKSFVPGLSLLGLGRRKGGMYAGKRGGMYAGGKKKLNPGLLAYLEKKRASKMK